MVGWGFPELDAMHDEANGDDEEHGEKDEEKGEGHRPQSGHSSPSRYLVRGVYHVAQRPA